MLHPKLMYTLKSKILTLKTVLVCKATQSGEKVYLHVCMQIHNTFFFARELRVLLQDALFLDLHKKFLPKTLHDCDNE